MGPVQIVQHGSSRYLDQRMLKDYHPFYEKYCFCSKFSGYKGNYDHKGDYDALTEERYDPAPHIYTYTNHELYGTSDSSSDYDYYDPDTDYTEQDEYLNSIAKNQPAPILSQSPIYQEVFREIVRLKFYP